MVEIIKKILSIIISIIMAYTGITDYKFSEKPDTEVNHEKLWDAINGSNEQAMLEAINEGADINKFEYNYCGTISPIIWACHSRSENRFIKTMLKYDLEPDVVDISGSTVFYESISERGDVYKKLLSSNPNVNFIDKDGNNAIYYAISSEYHIPEKVQELIDRGAVVTKKNIESLVELIESGRGLYIGILPYVNTLKILIDNYNGEDIDKNIYAAYRGRFTNNRFTNNKDNTVLYGIAGYCGKDILSESLKNDSDLELLLRIAIMANNFENTKYLLEHGANIVEDENYSNALIYAVEYNNYNMTDYIIHLNSDAINQGVYEAVSNNNIEILKLLLDNGADVNNKKAFDEALINDFDDIVKCFVERGFNVNGYDELNMNVYYVWVFSYCDLDTVKYIHEHSCHLNADELNEAMWYSVGQGDLELLKYSKELGADFSRDHVDSNGSRSDSQLIMAVGNGYLDIVKFLVDNGSNIDNYNDDEKKYFIKLAKNSNDIYNYLISKGII